MHLYRKHRDLLHLFNEPNNEINNDIQELDCDHVVHPAAEDSMMAMKKSNAYYLLKIKESNLLSQTCVDNIAEGSTHLVQKIVGTIKQQVEKCLHDASVDFDAVPGLQEMFDPDSILNNPFSHVATKQTPEKFNKENFGLIVSLYTAIRIRVHRL